MEERIVGEKLLSPSVQLKARPDGTVELLSTHDQLLGGVSGPSYQGCLFPADPAYSRLIRNPLSGIGDRLAVAGALGRFAIDSSWSATDPGNGRRTRSIELNLRKGGTMHPFLILQFQIGRAHV